MDRDRIYCQEKRGAPLGSVSGSSRLDAVMKALAKAKAKKEASSA